MGYTFLGLLCQVEEPRELSRNVSFLTALGIFKIWSDKALSNLVWIYGWYWVLSRRWEQRFPEVPSSLYGSVVLWIYENTLVQKKKCYTICLVLKTFSLKLLYIPADKIYWAVCWNQRTNRSLYWIGTYKKQIPLHVVISLRSDRRKEMANWPSEIRGRSESEGQDI